MVIGSGFYFLKFSLLNQYNPVHLTYRSGI